MSEMKHIVLSGVLCLGFTASLCTAVVLTNKTERIAVIAKHIQKTDYLTDQSVMDKEMAEILLPRMQAQHNKMKKRGELKKPDMVFVPEQLQQSRGY